MDELVLILILAECSFQHFIAKEMRTIVFENNSHGTASNILDKNISCLNIITNQQILNSQFFMKVVQCQPRPNHKTQLFWVKGFRLVPKCYTFSDFCQQYFVEKLDLGIQFCILKFSFNYSILLLMLQYCRFLSRESKLIYRQSSDYTVLQHHGLLNKTVFMN